MPLNNTVNTEWNPLVSVVLPIYGVEDKLYECLMSVCFQTMDEVEIICVNDRSPDNSQAIVDEFVSRFPGRVISVIHEENQGLAYARRTGLLQARAPYVLFVDSDDFVAGTICKTLLERMQAEELDICYYPFCRYHCDSRIMERFYPPVDGSKSTLIEKGLAAFWGAMYRREFLLEHIDTAFQKMFFEDAGSTPMLIDLAEHVGIEHSAAPMYFYYYGRAGSICNGTMTHQKILDHHKANLNAWESMSEENLPAYAKRAFARATNSVTAFPEAYDYGLLHLKELLEYTDPYFETYPAGRQKLVDLARSCPDTVRIPKIVYVNGFMKEQIRDFDRYLAQASAAYLYDPQVVVLDVDSCDMAQLPTWITSNEDKGLYFALQCMEREGGVYIAPYVEISTSFNREAFQGAFFVAGEANRVLPCAFGSEPNNSVVSFMVRTMREESWNSVPECMSHALVGECGVHLNSKDEQGLFDVHMLPLTKIIYGIDPANNYCNLNFNNLTEDTQNMAVIPQHLLDQNLLRIRAYIQGLETQAAALNKAKKDLDKANKELKKVKNELRSIKKSRAYKLLTVWYKVKKLVKNLKRS